MNFLPPPPIDLAYESCFGVQPKGLTSAEIEYSLASGEECPFTRPVLSEEATTSEAAYENWLSDTLDWGERRNLLAYRWCLAYSRFASEPIDCGADPSQ